jgi:hypothetical protein
MTRKPLTLFAPLFVSLLLFACTWENGADDGFISDRVQTVNCSRLLAVYARALQTRDAMDPAHGLYGQLLTTITATETVLANPLLYTSFTIALQAGVDTATGTLFDLLEIIDPTPKPPEVLE